jgi:hypothetical protein
MTPKPSGSFGGPALPERNSPALPAALARLGLTRFTAKKLQAYDQLAGPSDVAANS